MAVGSSTETGNMSRLPPDRPARGGGLVQSPSVTELPAVPQQESPQPKRQKRLTLSAMTRLIDDLSGEVAAEACAEDESMDDELEVSQTAPQRQRRRALTPMTGSAGPVPVESMATCSVLPVSPPQLAPCTPPELAPGTPPETFEVAPAFSQDTFACLPPPPQRSVRRPGPRRGVCDLSPLAAPPKRLSGVKRAREHRDSIGATARAEAMVETAAKTLAGASDEQGSDGFSTDEEMNSFANRVRHANSFLSGARVAETSRSADDLLSANLLSAPPVEAGIPLSFEGVPTMVLERGAGCGGGGGGGSCGVARTSPLAKGAVVTGAEFENPCTALSRSAFKSGVRAATVVAKVEAEMAASKSPSVKSPGAESSASKSSLRSPGADSASDGHSLGRHAAAWATTGRPNPPELDMLAMENLHHARVIAKSLFTP